MGSPGITGWYREGVLKRALGAALGLGALGYVLASGWWRCPTAAAFHFPCPGCGLTRATLAALRGDFHEAWHLHPLAFVASPLFAVLLGLPLVRYVLGVSRVTDVERRLDRALVGLLLLTTAAMLALWVARWFGALGGPVAI